jgi:ElaB/YqjD/DUF883 family membrane-anchored ribosome-binding protein
MRKASIVLDIQNEMVDQGKRLEDTRAGKLLVPHLERQIGEADEKLDMLDKAISEAGEAEQPKVLRLKRQRDSLEKQRQAKLNQRRRLQKQTGREVAERVEVEKKENRWKSKLAVFGTLFGLAVSVTVNLILPLAGVC